MLRNQMLQKIICLILKSIQIICQNTYFVSGESALCLQNAHNNNKKKYYKINPASDQCAKYLLVNRETIRTPYFVLDSKRSAIYIFGSA